MATEAVARRVLVIDAKIGKEALDAIKQMQQAVAGLEEKTNSVQTATKSLEKNLGTSFGRLAAGGAVIGAAVQGFRALGESITYPLTQSYAFNKGILETLAGLEKLRLGFMSVSKGASLGDIDAQIAGLRKFTSDLGIEFNASANALVKLRAAARGTAVEGAETERVFKAVALAARNFGLSGQQTSDALRAIEQMASKGRVQMEELRGQLGDQLPGAFQIAARAMGKTTSELFKMIEMGELLAEDFIPKFSRQLEQEMGANLPEGINAATVALQRQKNAWDELKQTAVDGKIGEFAAGQMDILTDTMTYVSAELKRAKDEGENLFLTIGKLIAGETGNFFKTLLNGYTSRAASTDELDKYNKELNALDVKIARQEQLMAMAGGYTDEQLKLLDEASRKEYQAHQAKLKTMHAERKVIEDNIRYELGWRENQKYYEDQEAKAKLEATRKERADEEKARQDLAMSGLRNYKRYLEEMSKIQEMVLTGVLTDPSDILKRTQWAWSEFGPKKNTDKAAQQADRQADAALRALEKELAINKRVLESGEESRRQIALEERVIASLTGLKGKEREEREKVVRAMLAENDAIMKQIEWREEQKKADEAGIKQAIASTEALRKENENAEAKAIRMRDGTEAMYDYRTAAIEATIADKESLYVQRMLDGASAEHLEALRKEIKELERKRVVQRDLSMSEKDQAERQKLAAEAAQINKEMVDSMIRAFENGDDVGKALLGSIQRVFMSNTLKVLIEPQTEAFATAIRDLANLTKKYLSEALEQSGFMKLVGGALSGFGGWVGGIFAANGAAFGHGGQPLTAFASGGVVTGPTLFSYGRGKPGIMGEAGEEAIMPLRRGPGGRLGVEAAGGGGTVVNIINNAGGNVTATAQERTGPDSSRIIDVMVEQSVQRAIGTGRFDRTFSSTYGLSRKGRK